MFVIVQVNRIWHVPINDFGSIESAWQIAPTHVDHDIELRQLAVATGQLGRPLPGAGSIRIPDRVHDLREYGVILRGP